MENTANKQTNDCLTLNEQNREIVKSEDGIVRIKMKNGKNYSIRQDRHRYFFPAEARIFLKTFDENSLEHLFFFTMLHSGGRPMEVLHLKPSSFDFAPGKGTIKFSVVKQRAAKKAYSLKGPRTFFVSENLIDAIKKYIRRHNIPSNAYFFLENLPANYENLSNTEKKEFYKKTEVAYAQMLKRHIKKAGIKDWNQFSLHNLRKTWINWMRTFDLKDSEICYRAGHDLKTQMDHYGSALIFSTQERMDIMKFFGDVK